MSSSQSALDRMHAEHEEVRRSPDHVIEALTDMFAAVEPARAGGSYIRLYLRPISRTVDGWIAVDLHLDDAARIVADLGGALRDVLFDRMVNGGEGGPA